MMEFKMANYEGARLAYSLEGRRADLLERQETALIDAPLLKIYQQETQGKLLAEARGASGTLDLATKNIVLEGSVVYHVIPREQRLNTSKLIYRTAEHEMEVPEGTGYTLRTPQGTVDGSGLVAKEDLTQ
ncbi:MAG: LPS export ABC transporter periplasmic protein LptC [Elusimicrobia bacterium]|nr:LPS export ABC transporter periplasmic protein LptC [Elusimicrobiota bacterium]